jgi:hypothetical protein
MNMKKFKIVFLNGQEWEIPSLHAIKMFKNELFFFDKDTKGIMEKIAIFPFKVNNKRKV